MLGHGYPIVVKGLIKLVNFQYRASSVASASAFSGFKNAIREASSGFKKAIRKHFIFHTLRKQRRDNKLQTLCKSIFANFVNVF